MCSVQSVQIWRGMGSEFQREGNYTLEQYIVISSVELMVTSQGICAIMHCTYPERKKDDEKEKDPNSDFIQYVSW